MPPIKNRPDPVVPDHEVLRKIGGGAYGEVWLARGVTGALRAVKVVWREDFDDARGFEREFEGILKFEPISRTHPGLVNILHVGRSPDGTSFYYYVMELGDDVRTGAEINAIEYEPRTLRADTKLACGVRLETNLCIDVGLRLAEALDHLHELGLAHRDVKPANVIFVNGKAKLADIGLVATRGQRTFVGTEGFVPPEGPGSAQADVYSLGKVLYEIATGKDRLDFPELPDESPPPEEKKRWLELNRIICDICDPQLSRRKITTAAELADALRRLQRGKRRRQTGLAAWMTAIVLGVFIALGTWESLKDSPVMNWFSSPQQITTVPEVVEKFGQIRVVSYPEGAEVIGPDEQWLGVTPLTLKAAVGSEVEYLIRKPGFRPMTVRGKVPPSAVNEPLPLGSELGIFSPPEIGASWEDHQGGSYQPIANEHLASLLVSEASWRRFVNVTKRKIEAVEFFPISQSGRPIPSVLASKGEANAYCAWLREAAIKEGYLTADHEMLAKFDEGFNDPALSERARNEGLKPFRILVRLIPYGRIILTTTPPGAAVYLNNGPMVGDTTPLEIDKVKPGPVTLTIVLDGYKPLTLNLEMKPDDLITLDKPLQENQGVRFDKPWKNGLGMRFVPYGAEGELMVSIWETRISDYDAFVAERGSGAKPLRKPDFAQTKDHPVVYVTRDEARNFCAWLTKRERTEERISVAHTYRLLTDLEWSRIAGIAEVAGQSPGERDIRKPLVFQWGSAWPPPANYANLADISAAKAPGVPANRTIEGYDDRFETTAPVGSFPPNAAGLYDLCGNVHEWVNDDLTAAKAGHTTYGVLRGGGWNSFQPENLYTGARNAVPPNLSDNIYGFRVVLAKVPSKPDNITDP